jgi:segregation and condensation protein A
VTNTYESMEKPIQLKNFSGPLDLLLQLVETKEMEITAVSLAEVAEQFLLYIEDIDEKHPDELADFLVIATKLLLLKSQALLPFLQIDQEETDPGELAAQLKMYKQYAQATGVIEGIITQQRFLYPKKQVKQQARAVHFHPPEGLGSKELHALFLDVLSRLEPVVKIPKAAIQKVVSLREKFVQIQSMIEKHVKLHFYQLLADSKDRGEVVVTFLALLELVKQRVVDVKQDKSFSNITIEKTEQ